MAHSRNLWLMIGASLSAAAALLHLTCIIVGAPLYLFIGAGKKIAAMADAGYWYPTFVTCLIAGILLLWSLYALSGAGIIRRLPLLRLALCAITAIYLVRSVSFALLMPYFPDNSATLWFWTSFICFVFGVIHLVGTWQVWTTLSQ